LVVGSSDAPVDAANSTPVSSASSTVPRQDSTSPARRDGPRTTRGSLTRPSPKDGYGNALAAADVGLGPQDDLAVGIHAEDHDAGAVHVLYGTTAGLSADRDQLWTQASLGVADEPETDDALGLKLAPGRFHDSGFRGRSCRVRTDFQRLTASTRIR
jgi:hypothetical protein